MRLNQQSTTSVEANEGNSQQTSIDNRNSSDCKPASGAVVAVAGDGERTSGEKGGVRRQGRRRRSVSFCFVLKVYLIPRVTDFRESEAGEVWWSQEQLEEMRQREHARLMALRRSGGHGSGAAIEPGRRQLHNSHNRRVVRILPRGVATHHNASPRGHSFPLPNYTSYGYIP